MSDGLYEVSFNVPGVLMIETCRDPLEVATTALDAIRDAGSASWWEPVFGDPSFTVRRIEVD